MCFASGGERPKNIRPASVMEADRQANISRMRKRTASQVNSDIARIQNTPLTSQESEQRRSQYAAWASRERETPNPYSKLPENRLAALKETTTYIGLAKNTNKLKVSKNGR